MVDFDSLSMSGIYFSPTLQHSLPKEDKRVIQQEYVGRKFGIYANFVEDYLLVQVNQIGGYDGVELFVLGHDY